MCCVVLFCSGQYYNGLGYTSSLKCSVQYCSVLDSAIMDWDIQYFSVSFPFSGLASQANVYYRMMLTWTNEKVQSAHGTRGTFDFKNRECTDTVSFLLCTQEHCTVRTQRTEPVRGWADSQCKTAALHCNKGQSPGPSLTCCSTSILLCSVVTSTLLTCSFLIVHVRGGCSLSV